MENKTAIIAISKPLSELVEKLVTYGYRNHYEFLDDWEKIFVEHEQMFKEQIMMAYNDGRVNEGLKQNKNSEQYFNQTYGTK